MIKLYYKYSTLDKQHQFGIISDNPDDSIYLWVFYHIGELMGSNKLKQGKEWNIYPYNWAGTKLIGEYKPHDAIIIAKLIFNKIHKRIWKDIKLEYCKCKKHYRGGYEDKEGNWVCYNCDKMIKEDNN